MFPVKCTQCDEVFARNKLPFHIREAHGPRRSNFAPVEPAQQSQPRAESWERFRAKQATPPPDVQDDRNLFRLEIQNIVREFNALSSQACQECSDNVEDMPVLGALYAYTFTHLKLCAPNNGSLLDELENLNARWVREDDECFLDLKNTKDALVRILAESQVERHICNTRLINEHRLHDLDINNIVALVVKHTTSREHAHAFYAMADTKAQYMVDTLQNLLVLQSEGVKKYRRYLLNAIITLSRKSGRFPQSLLLRHIQDLKKTTFGGGYGSIYEGKLNGRVVAIKKTKDENKPLEQLLKEFCNEAVVWRHVRHSNCLPFYGVYVLDEDKMCLVSPWMINGHVIDYLRGNPSTDRLPLILDVACGLEYLHSMQPAIIHGDLKGANILITSSGRACLADFGISVVGFSQVQMTTTFDPRGTRYFMAPEFLRASLGSADDLKKLDRRRCDMYAFGCVCYEIYTGMHPTHNPLAKSRPQRPPDPKYVRQGLDDNMWSFVEKLWQENPTVRWTADEARKWISSRMKSQGKNDVRPFNEVEWDVGFLADAAVTMAVEDSFALAHT